MNHVWSLLCGSMSIDKRSNRISLFDLIEQIQLTVESPTDRDGIILVPVSFDLVTMWERSDPGAGETGRYRLAINGPSGSLGLSRPVQIDLTQTRRNRSVTHLTALPVDPSTPGTADYTIDVESEGIEDEWSAVGVVTIEVDLTLAGSESESDSGDA